MTLTPARTRFAPSPTGHLHLGGARTALYPYLLARQTGGKFILRIEDTDVKRTVPGSEQEIIDGLHWLGLEYDEGPDIGGAFGPYRQTERRDIYTAHASRLVQGGHAYPCFCTPERLTKMREEQQARKEAPRYDGLCRKLTPEDAAKRIAAGERHVIRFKMPHEGTTVAHDHIRGDITVENKNVDDYVVLKSDGLPTYHLAAIVDDHEMQITHVLRSSEWLGTFPLHVNIVQAFGWQEPLWAHLSVFLKPSGKGKMSKREGAEAIKDGHSVFVKDLQDLGFIPEGVNNWCGLMGWGVPEDDVMNMEQMIQRFSIDSLTPSPAAINFAKLDHFNGTHIRLLPTDDLVVRIKPFFTRAGLVADDAMLTQIVPLLRERMVTLDDAVELAGFFFRDSVMPNPSDLIAKGLDAAKSAEIARRAYQILVGQPDLSHAGAEPTLRTYVEESGLNVNQVFGILRVAVTGQKVSPPLFESMEIIGREKVLARLDAAANALSTLAGI